MFLYIFSWQEQKEEEEEGGRISQKGRSESQGEECPAEESIC